MRYEILHSQAPLSPGARSAFCPPLGNFTCRVEGGCMAEVGGEGGLRWPQSSSKCFCQVAGKTVPARCLWDVV